MPKIHTEFEQRSVDWMIARAGKPTASEFDSLITPEFEVRTGQMRATYLAKKVAEAWLGGPLAGFNVFDMDQGNLLEEEAIPFYEFEFSEAIQRVGLVTTDDGRIACSPDGLIGKDGGIEIKCPEVHTHLKYLMAGELPKEYVAQVHGAMYVTGRQWWKFMSYCRHFPVFITTVPRSEQAQAAIHEAVTGFLATLDNWIERLTKMNKGVRPTRRHMTPQPTE